MAQYGGDVVNKKTMLAWLLMSLCVSAVFAESQFDDWKKKGMDENDPSRKIYYYNNAIKVWEPKDSKDSLSFVYSMLGAAYVTLGQADFAIKAENNALKFGDPNDVLSHNVRGTAYRIKHRYEKALADFTIALANAKKYTDKERAVLYMNLCIAYTPLEEYEKALGSCNKGDFSDSITAGGDYMKRGLVYVELGKIDLGFKDLEKAMELVSDKSIAVNSKESGELGKSTLYTYLGYAHFMNRDYKAALENYNAAIRMSPRNAEAYWRRGRLYSELDQAAAALKDYEQAVDLDPEFAEAYQWKGYWYFKHNQYAMALKDFNKALGISSLPTARLHRGFCYVAMKRYKAAISDLDKFIAVKAGVPDAYNARGKAYEGSGDSEFALGDYNTACNLGSQEACLNVKRIGR